MARKDRTGNRKTREQRLPRKIPELGYYLVTEKQKLEQCIGDGKTKPSDMCPATTVYELVGEIREKVK